MAETNRDVVDMTGKNNPITHLQELAGTSQIKYTNISDNKIVEANVTVNVQGSGPSTILIDKGTVNNKNEKVIKKFDVGLLKPEESFIGRTKERKNLRELLERKGKCIAITGMGGIGKSELARKYADENKQQYGGNIAWIAAETSGELAKGFHELAFKLGIQTKIEGIYRKIEEILKDIYKHIQDHVETGLIIFDNVNNMREIGPYLPSRYTDNCKLNILLTSQNIEFPKITPLQLNVLSDEEAMEFVKEQLKLDNHVEEEIRKLVHKLQNLPLALQQAVAYIIDKAEYEGPYTVRNYLEDFVKVHREKEFPETFVNKYDKTVYVSVELSLNKINNGKDEGKLAVELLYIMAYLVPDNIDQNLIYELKGGELNKQEIAAAFRQLTKISLITKKEYLYATKYIIHRLVQTVLRTMNTDRSVNDERRDTLHKVINILNNKNRSMDYNSHYRAVLTNVEESDLTIIEKYFQNQSELEKKTLFCILSRFGCLKSMEYITKNRPDLVKCQDSTGTTPLLAAAETGHTKIVEWLIKHDVNLNTTNDKGQTVLHKAATEGHTETVECLIKHGMDVNWTDNYGQTALYLAASCVKTETVECLIKHGADINCTDNDGRPALHKAAEWGGTETVECLIKHGVDVNCTDNDNRTGLHGAAGGGYNETIKFLIKHNADINATDNQGWTALHWATEYQRSKTIRQLLISGARDDICTNKGQTALQLALERVSLKPIVQRPYLQRRYKQVIQILDKHAQESSKKENNVSNVENSK